MSATRVHRTNGNPFKSLNIIYYALTTGQILIAAVLTFLVHDGTKEIGFSWDMSNPFHIVAPVLMLGCISMGTMLYGKKLREGRSISGLHQKLEHYRGTIIMRSGLLEGANLTCLIFFFLEQNYFFLFLFLIGFGAFLLVRPSEEIFRENYKLSMEESMELKTMTSQ